MSRVLSCQPLLPRPESVAAELARAPAGPLILVSRSGVLANLARVRSALPSVSVHYAVKACNHPQVLSALAQADCGFELASAGEWPALAALDIDPARAVVGNPVRSAMQTAALYAAGVRCFAIDSLQQLDRDRVAAPDARLLVRVAVPPGCLADADVAAWPMGDTFGASPDTVAQISHKARAAGQVLAGVSFHVGSQCTDMAAWQRGLNAAVSALATLRAEGHAADVLSLGGGFPAEIGAAPSIEAIGESLRPALAALPVGTRLLAEPGRCLIANAGVLLTRVLAVREHRGARWLHLDCGVHNGLIESSRGVPYALRALRGSGTRVAWQVAGPSCDGADRLPGEWLLPAAIVEGDWLAVDGAAAYAQSRASGFNGFALPETRVVN